ncbi:CoA ester lyase [Rhizobium sp. TH2]|uniref:HpcH/HpaI aldolase/citrate lyase family protein n=1 Tax=Rhizobium sp. TH2 TaxID=2775403 RepID=UPI0021579C92|nr:CoA ester lyase [Rhizobium sp. TH2]UVC08325.1 CoA ester lyase [Rhizobium sp. TH2]
MSMIFDHHPQHLRRSVLCLPASNQRAIDKLAELDCDAVILDLEDAVAEEKKEEARANIRAFFKARGTADREVIIRINQASSTHYDTDMALVLECEPDAVLLPKVRAQDDILDVAVFLSENDAPETIRLWAMMETPLAILNAGPIAEAGRTAGGRLDCLVMGLNDLRNDTRIPFDPARTYLIHWLMQVVLAARAFGLTVIDSVSNDFKDLAQFEAECIQGRAMGFDGKMLIHPAQIDAPNRIFQPSAEELAEAEAIVAAFSTPEAQGKNAINVAGRMVERLHFEQAGRIAARARMIQARMTKAGKKI